MQCNPRFTLLSLPNTHIDNSRAIVLHDVLSFLSRVIAGAVNCRCGERQQTLPQQTGGTPRFAATSHRGSCEPRLDHSLLRATKSALKGRWSGQATQALVVAISAALGASQQTCRKQAGYRLRPKLEAQVFCTGGSIRFRVKFGQCAQLQALQCSAAGGALLIGDCAAYSISLHVHTAGQVFRGIRDFAGFSPVGCPWWLRSLHVRFRNLIACMQANSAAGITRSEANSKANQGEHCCSPPAAAGVLAALCQLPCRRWRLCTLCEHQNLEVFSPSV